DAALCLLAGLLSGHGRLPSGSHRACRDVCTTASPALGARRGSDPGRVVNTDSNACRAREVERNVRRNDFLWWQAISSEQWCRLYKADTSPRISRELLIRAVARTGCRKLPWADSARSCSASS